jgi:dienelactone hydrolase
MKSTISGAACAALVALIFVCLTVSQKSYAQQQDPPLDSPDAPLNERIVNVPTSAPPIVKLQVTLYMPSHGGPFPLAIVNHGASHDPLSAPRISDNFAAYYFLSRGFAVALPMMRGYAGSQGHMRPYGCDVLNLGMDAAHDILDVVDFVRQVPGIDATRIVVAGKSMGGWNTLTFGSLNPPNVRGLVNFAGGVKESDCNNPDASLISAAGQLGARTKIPSLWFYGDNDSIFSTSTWRAMFKQYLGSGASAELFDYGTFMTDAHSITANGAGLPLWVPKADAFLAKIGLPNINAYPQYLPKGAPVDTHYAEVNDVDAVPYLTDSQRELYRRFLKAPLPRAIAIGRTNAGVASGGFDPTVTAMTRCWKITQYCHLYAIDNTVVWPKPAMTDKGSPLPIASAVPYLNANGRKAYEVFLKMHRPRAFAISNDGAWGSASGLDPIEDALVACAQGHQGCRIYAIDAAVIWSKN